MRIGYDFVVCSSLTRVSMASYGLNKWSVLGMVRNGTEQLALAIVSCQLVPNHDGSLV